MFVLASCLLEFLFDLKTEAVRSSESLVKFYQTTLCHIQEHSARHSIRCKNITTKETQDL
jgi:hypothetical protein